MPSQTRKEIDIARAAYAEGLIYAGYAPGGARDRAARKYPYPTESVPKVITISEGRKVRVVTVCGKPRVEFKQQSSGLWSLGRLTEADFRSILDLYNEPNELRELE